MDERRVLLRALGLLLEYPDEHFGDLLRSVRQALAELSPSSARSRLLEVIDCLARTDPLALGEEYARLFDFSPDTSLNLTYHKWGDARDRGMALAGLRRMYEEAGLKPATPELPDFLPLVLEFLSLAPEDSCRRVLEEYRDEVADLARRVAVSSSVYGTILGVLPEVALG